MDTKEGKPWGGGDGGVTNWAIGIDIYTLMCIKLMTIQDKPKEEHAKTHINQTVKN